MNKEHSHKLNKSPGGCWHEGARLTSPVSAGSVPRPGVLLSLYTAQRRLVSRKKYTGCPLWLPVFVRRWNKVPFGSCPGD